MRFLITGANGQVGRELRRALAPLGEIVASSRDGHLADGRDGEAADLSRPATLPALLDRLHPDVIVNAAAYTAVDRAESEPALARRINAEAVRVMAEWAATHDTPLVHYSTDYVFDGRHPRPRREDDATAPLGVYGTSKLSGEHAVRDSGATHLVFRTAWVYAAHGHNFLASMLRLATERDRLRVVDDQHGTPTPAGLIADVTAEVLRQWLPMPRRTRTAHAGTYHLVAEGQTTWCGFARAIMRRARELGLIDHPVTVEAITSADYPTPAARPAWSVLDTSHLRGAFDVALPAWEVGLDAVLASLAS